MPDERSSGQQRTPFLAVHELPEGSVSDALQETFHRVAKAAQARGVKAVVTFYSPGKRHAYTFFEDDSAEHVRATCESAGLRVEEVVRGEKLGERLRG